MAKQFKIQENLLQVVVNYLATKPYQEVARLVEALMQLPFEEIPNEAILSKSVGTDQDSIQKEQQECNCPAKC
jgi:hypothetical protein